MLKSIFFKTCYQWLDIIFWAQNVFYYDPRCSATRCASNYYNMYPIIKVKKKNAYFINPNLKGPKKHPKRPQKNHHRLGQPCPSHLFFKRDGPRLFAWALAHCMGSGVVVQNPNKLKLPHSLSPTCWGPATCIDSFFTSNGIMHLARAQHFLENFQDRIRVL
jgi:hypothetical protein